MENQVAVLIVIYNKTCESSSSCQSLLAGDIKNQVIIYDNSTSDLGNKAFCNAHGWKYMGNGQNQGLSVAYNQGVQVAREAGQRFICLLDDDSNVSAGYWEAVDNSIKNNPADIYFPIVKTDQKILSPCRISSLGLAKIFETEEQAKCYKGKDLSAINSGMVIALSVFDTYQYDEKIFLDGIDHEFMRMAWQDGRKVVILDYCMHHEFSEETITEVKPAWNRYKIFAKDMKRLAGKNHMMYIVTVGRRALRLTLQFRTGKFLQTFFKIGANKNP